MELELTAVFRRVPEGYIAFVEELPGANTQGATLEEARANLKEAVALVLEANRALASEDGAGADVIRESLKVSGWSDATCFGTWKPTGANSSERDPTTPSTSIERRAKSRPYRATGKSTTTSPGRSVRICKFHVRVPSDLGITPRPVFGRSGACPG